MKTFSGFPSGKVAMVGIPRPAFTELLPLIDDLAELKLTLHALWRLSEQRGKTRYLSLDDLTDDDTLLASLSELTADGSVMKILHDALDRAVERGTLLRVKPPRRSEIDALYFANTAKGRAGAEAVARGEVPENVEPGDRPNIFTLYEQNIGILTPLIAEELREAEQAYPPLWIEDAFREAVDLNKRSWRYIRAILENWKSEGRVERRDPEKRRRDIDGDYGEYIQH
jgi:DnaD/phage-associated family protein